MLVCFYRIHGSPKISDEELLKRATRETDFLINEATLATMGVSGLMRDYDTRMKIKYGSEWDLEYSNEITVTSPTNYNELLMSKRTIYELDTTGKEKMALLKERGYSEMIDNWHQVYLKEISKMSELRDVIFNTYKDFKYPLTRDFKLNISCREMSDVDIDKFKDYFAN